MPTSQYFNNFNSKGEQRLYEDLINETVKQWGIDSFYLPRTSDSQVDLIFGDDPTKKFDEAYPVEVYVKNVDNFEGQELFSKFGLEIQHQVRFIMTTKAFSARVPSKYSRPREGDLLWLTNFQALFEIKFVNQQYFFYAFGNQNFYGFELVCERFRYAEENVTTGIVEIDDAVDKVAIAYDFTMVSHGTGTYQIGEQVYQGNSFDTATATATVVSWDLPTSILKLKQIQGLFLSNNSIVGNTSKANYMLYSFDGLNNVNNKLDNNSEFGILADDILDFSEHNPFGDPTQVTVPSDFTIFVNNNDQQTKFKNNSGNQVNFPIGTKAPKDVI
jgi:Virus neck protein